MQPNVRSIYAPGEYVDSIVSCVEGPRKFYVQPLAFAAELRRLTKHIQALYSTDLVAEMDYTIPLDDLNACLRSTTPCWCAAPFRIETPPNMPPIPTFYYRAIVLERAGPSSVKVFYVDYGNTAKVAITTLKKLPQSYRDELPCMAVPCRLVEGEVVSGENLIQPENLRSVVDGFHVVVHVSENPQNTLDPQRLPHAANPLLVSMFITDGKEDVNVGEMLLIQQGNVPNGH